MAEQNNRPPITPNALDVMSTWMFAPPVHEGSKRPNLRVKVVGNVPRIVVKTNVDGDKNNGRIDFNTDTPTFSAMLSALSRLIRGEIDKADFDYIDDFVAGKKLDKKMTLATLKIGRTKEDGRIFMAVIGYERPKIQFVFGPSQYHNVKVNGEELSPKEISEYYAESFIRWAGELVMNLLVSEFNPDGKNVAKAPNMQNQGQGGNGGGYNNRGGGGGYNNNRNSGGGGNAEVEAFDDFD